MKEKNKYQWTKKRKEELSKKMKIIMNEPDMIKKISKATKIAMNRPEVKAKLQEPKSAEHKKELKIAANKRWKDPREREKARKASKKNWQNPEYRKKNKTSTGKTWTGWKKGLTKEIDRRVAQQAKSVKKTLNRPEKIKRSSEITKKYFQNPKNRKKTSEATKNAMNSPKIKKRFREIMKKPEMREKYSMAWEKRAESSGYPRNYLCPNFNIFASEVFKVIDIKLNTRGRYGGTEEGEKKIGRYFVDYFNRRFGVIIEWNEPNHYTNGNLNSYDIKKRNYILERYPDYHYFFIRQSDWINLKEDLTEADK